MFSLDKVDQSVVTRTDVWGFKGAVKLGGVVISIFTVLQIQVCEQGETKRGGSQNNKQFCPWFLQGKGKRWIVSLILPNFAYSPPDNRQCKVDRSLNTFSYTGRLSWDYELLETLLKKLAQSTTQLICGSGSQEKFKARAAGYMAGMPLVLATT